MDITINHILYLIVFLAVFVYLLKINRAIYYFIMSCLLMIFFLVSGDLTMSIAVSGVLTALIFIFVDNQPLKKRKSMLRMEHFEGGEDDEEEQNEEEEEEKPKKKNKNKIEKKEENNDDENFTVNTKESYMDLVNQLNPTEVNSLNNDTRELIQTQKQLMETLSNMGPALKEGKNILDTFKNYFGDENSMKDLLKM